MLFQADYLFHTVEEGVHKLTYAFLVPIFFVSIGLEANARALLYRESQLSQKRALRVETLTWSANHDTITFGTGF